MTDRASTLLAARRERLERVLGRSVPAPTRSSDEPLSAEARRYLLEEAQSLYWNDLEWENITDEEALEEGPIAQLIFPGFLAYVRGLLLEEVMPDSQAPATPRPEIVDDLLGFLAGRIVSIEDGLSDPVDDPSEAEGQQTELDLASQLVDLVLCLYHGLGPEDVERIERAGRARD